MNWHHLRILLWVRWRLTVNHIRRNGKLGLILTFIAGGLCLLLSIAGFFVALIGGQYALPEASAVTVMFVSDGWVLAFLTFWTLGVVIELQRSELLSVDKLLHLPTTLNEVFLFNFLGSLISLTTVTLVPTMLGFSIAMVLVKGPASLVMFPLVATFVLMVCAVTYQFRGWLAILMANKRRQQTIMMILGISLLFLSQLPNVITHRLQRQLRTESVIGESSQQKQRNELRGKYNARQITFEEYARQDAEISKLIQEERVVREQLVQHRFNRILTILNLALPVGWIAYGAKAAVDGNPWPGLVGVLGMGGIALVSLRRSYTTTLRYFTSDFNRGTQSAGAREAIAPLTGTVPSSKSKLKMVEWSIPLVSEPVSAIAWTTLRSLLRAPEVKMILIGPLSMVLLYGIMVFPNLNHMGYSSLFRSFIPIGILGMSIAGLAQLSQNCFGFDRSGFRTYVLSSVPRHEILMGKNLALVPLLVLSTLPLLTIAQCLSPVPWTHFVATLLEIPTAYLALSLLGNAASILSPLGYAGGSMRPANYKELTALIQVLFGIAAVVVLGAVSALPLGTELFFQYCCGVSTAIPTALICAVLELACATWFYLVILRWQGELLQARECRILQIITEKGE